MESNPNDMKFKTVENINSGIPAEEDKVDIPEAEEMYFELDVLKTQFIGFVKTK